MKTLLDALLYISLLPSHDIFRHLQITHVCTEASSPSKEKAEVLRVCLCGFDLGHNCDSKGLHGSKRQALPGPFIFTVVGYFSFFDCLLDAESSSVIESECKGTGTQERL